MSIGIDGLPMDEKCPNWDYRGPEHIGRLEFLSLIRT